MDRTRLPGRPAIHRPSDRVDTVGPCRLVLRSGGPLRAALLGRLRVDRTRLPGRPAIHRPSGALTSAQFRGERVWLAPVAQLGCRLLLTVTDMPRVITTVRSRNVVVDDRINLPCLALHRWGELRELVRADGRLSGGRGDGTLESGPVGPGYRAFLTRFCPLGAGASSACPAYVGALHKVPSSWGLAFWSGGCKALAHGLPRLAQPASPARLVFTADLSTCSSRSPARFPRPRWGRRRAGARQQSLRHPVARPGTRDRSRTREGALSSRHRPAHLTRHRAVPLYRKLHALDEGAVLSQHAERHSRGPEGFLSDGRLGEVAVPAMLRCVAGGGGR